MFDLVELCHEGHELLTLVFHFATLLFRDRQLDLELLFVLHLLLDLFLQVPVDLQELLVLLVHQVDVAVDFNLLLVLVLRVKV